MAKTVYLVKLPDGYVTTKYIKNGYELSEDVHDARPYVRLHAALKMLIDTGNHGIIEAVDSGNWKNKLGSVEPAHVNVR